MSAESRTDRHRGREVALQLLYQWEVGKGSTLDSDEIDLFWEMDSTSDVRRVFASQLVEGTQDNLEKIDPLLDASADNWRLGRMAVVDRLIMRMAVYELLCTGTPRAVVIDEALELAKTFSSDESVGFINGVLDRVRRQLDET